MAIEISVDAFIDKVFASFKKITPALVAMALVSGAVLFLPQSVLVMLGLDGITDGTRTIVGLFFLLFAALIITIAASSLWQIAAKKFKRNRQLKKLKDNYLSLAPEQKRIVLKLLKSKDKVVTLDLASGNTQYLRENHFIYAPDQYVIPGYDEEMCVKYVPHPWLIDLYNKEPDLFR